MNKLICITIMAFSLFPSCASRKDSPDAQYEEKKRKCYRYALSYNLGQLSVSQFSDSTLPSQASQLSASTLLAKCIDDAEKEKKKDNAKDTTIFYY